MLHSRLRTSFIVRLAKQANWTSCLYSAEKQKTTVFAIPFQALLFFIMFLDTFSERAYAIWQDKMKQRYLF